MLDAEHARARALPAQRARRRAAEAGALRRGRRAQHRGLLLRRATRSRSSRSSAPRPRSAPRARASSSPLGDLADCRPRGAAHHRGRGLPPLRRVRGPVGPAPVLLAGCTSTSAWRAPRPAWTALEAVLPWLPRRARASRRTRPMSPGARPGSPRRARRSWPCFPGAGRRPVFDSYAEWEAFAERLLALGLADEYTRIWWDVRPHPRFGTLEVRMPISRRGSRRPPRSPGCPRARRVGAEAGPARRSRRLRGEPLGRAAVSAATRGSIHPTGDAARHGPGARSTSSRSRLGEAVARPRSGARPGGRTARARSCGGPRCPLRAAGGAHVGSRRGRSSETLQVTGVRCERCVMRLGDALQKLEGIESANANLMGQVTLAWDEERLPREEIVAALERAGFQPCALAGIPRRSGCRAVVVVRVRAVSEGTTPETDARRIAEEARDRARFEEEVLELSDQVYRVARRLVSIARGSRRPGPGHLRPGLPQLALVHPRHEPARLDLSHPHEPQHRPRAPRAARARHAADRGRRLLPLQPARGRDRGRATRSGSSSASRRTAIVEALSAVPTTSAT